MTPEQLEELMALNPEGVNLTYSVTADAAGQVTDRTVVCNVNARNVAGLRNGLFNYCDRFAKGEDIE